MTKYREILRLLSLGISERKIAESCGVSRNTVSRIRKRADEIGLKWPLDASQTDKVLETRLYPKGTVDINSKRMPDYEYIRKELLKNGVTKKLLWTEYLEECRQSGENPLMYSQFCYHIQQNEQKRRATMHIPRKPGELIEVDWAGDPAHIIDPDTGEITDAWIFVGVLTYSQYAYVEAFVVNRATGIPQSLTRHTMKWQSTITRLSYPPAFGAQKTSRSPKGPLATYPHGSLQH